MAFTRSNLTALAYGNGFTLWHYTETGAAQATMDGSGYFNDASDVMAVGDMLIVRSSDTGLGLSVVSSNSAGVVDVNNFTGAGTTDTD